MRHWFLARRQPPPRRGRRPAYRPLLETLEDRRLLAPVITQILGQPVSPTPTLSVPDGKTLVVPITTTDSGQTVTYSTTPTNGFQVTVENGNPFIQFNVTSTGTTTLSGTLTFELFQDLTPNTVATIEGLVQSGFYNNTSFNRIIPNFVVQGPANSVSGLSFDDEFKPQLIYDGNGQLGMANSGKDTNNAAVFFTYISPTDPTFAADEAQLRGIDFNNTIFGQLVGGSGTVNSSSVSAFDLLKAINSLGTAGSGTPTQTVTITSASVVQDTTDGVLLVTAPGSNATGTITVTASDGAGGTDTRSFNISSTADTTNDPPILGPVGNQDVAAGTSVNLNLTATDIGSGGLEDIANATGTNANDVTIVPSGHVDAAGLSTDGKFTVIPKSGFTGTVQIQVGVKRAGATSRGNTQGSSATDPAIFDTQTIQVGFGVTQLTAVTPKPVTATAGTATGTITVGTFQDSGDTNANDFTATINWGDGNIGSGTVSTDPSNSSLFDVRGSNTYAHPGFYPVSMTITHTPDSVTATANTSASVSSPSFTSVTGVAVSGTEGTSTGSVEVASFTFSDTSVSSSASNSPFTASINWGDGHVTTGTVTGSNGNFTVDGSNTYAEAGTDTVQVTITYTGTGNSNSTPPTNTGDTGQASTTATVADAALTARGATVNATAGVAFHGVVATFTDANPTPNVNDFTATIAWGDGTTSTGTVVASGSTFEVVGSHTYATAGDFTVHANITDNGPAGSGVPSSTATATGTALVAAAPLGPATAPLSPLQLFVNQAYLDLLGVLPDSGTQGVLVGELSSGTSPLTMVQQIQSLPEYLTHQLTDLYLAVLQTAPTTAELNQALSYLDHGGSWLGLTQRLVSSGAFFALHGGTAAGFLAALGQVFFGGPLAPTLQGQLAGMLAGGSSQAAVVQQLVNDLTGNARLQTQARAAEVQNLYQALLHRSATQDEVTTQLKALAQGKSLDDIIAALVASDEYFQKVAATA
jgi:cyclophilin family peptidyl-prolyl cis-trans isomerase